MHRPLVGAIRMRAVQRHKGDRQRANRGQDHADTQITAPRERLDNERRPKRVSIETKCG